MRILSGQTVEISNRDLETLRNGKYYATVHLAVLRVRGKTRKFQLPEDCVLLAVEGNATAAALEQICAIWCSENLSLEAGVAKHKSSIAMHCADCEHFFRGRQLEECRIGYLDVALP
jgi:hypothetical protein